MGLDIKTLFVADVAVLLLTAVLSLQYWRRDRDDWLLWWASGMAMVGVAMLGLGMFGPVPPPAVGLPGATLSFAGFLLVWQSMRRLNGRAARPVLVAAFVAAFAVVLTAALAVGTDLHERA